MTGWPDLQVPEVLVSSNDGIQHLWWRETCVPTQRAICGHRAYSGTLIDREGPPCSPCVDELCRQVNAGLTRIDVVFLEEVARKLHAWEAGGGRHRASESLPSNEFHPV